MNDGSVKHRPLNFGSTNSTIMPAIAMPPMAETDDITRSALLWSLMVYIVTYILLQKKMLPKSLWLPLTKFYFYPMIVPNYIWRNLFVRGPYFSRVDDSLFLGAVPLVCAGHVSLLHSMGVRSVVNMCAEYAGPVNAYASMSPPIKQLHLPVTDHLEPSVDQLRSAVAFIVENSRNGGKVLVHCKGGHGRSAAVALAYLISEAGGSLSPGDAQALLNSVRHVRKALYLQPELVRFHKLRWQKGAGAAPAA